MRKFSSYFVGCALLVSAVFAFAQETKPAPAPATPASPVVAPAPVTPTVAAAPVVKAPHHPAVPKHTCKQPEAPGKLGSDNQQKNFVKDMDGYRDCLIAYRTEMNKLAQFHVDAANAAVEEFNDYAASLRKK
jgi:hypothetical protein